MAIATVVTGDDLSIPVTLKLNKSTFDMRGKTCKARLVSTDHETVFTEEITQNEAASGADWANSKVIVEMTGIDTQDIKYQGKAKCEIQVEFPKKQTWWIQVQIVKGNIA